MKTHERLEKVFAEHGMTYTGQLPTGYGTNGRRSHGDCPICTHTGSSCRCSAAKFWLHWLDERKRQRIRENAEGLLAALKHLLDYSNRQCADNSDDALLWAQAAAIAAAAIAKAEGTMTADTEPRLVRIAREDGADVGIARTIANATGEKPNA